MLVFLIITAVKLAVIAGVFMTTLAEIPVPVELERTRLYLLSPDRENRMAAMRADFSIALPT